MRALVLVAILGVPVTAQAQLAFEVAGARALGMAGAFVAVADDATAVHWNPAGLLNGPVAGVTIGWDRFQFGNPDAIPGVGHARREGRLTSVGSWPLGISFGTHKSVAVVESGQAGTARVEGLRVSHVGATVLQTLLPGLVLGATVKYLRGAPLGAEMTADSSREVLDLAMDLDARSTGAVDLDLGLMADAGRVRAGLVVKNVRQPAFGPDAETAIRLPRRVRAGVSATPVDGVTLALDMDLDTADPLVGLRRAIALGGETRVGSRLQLRAGFRWHRGDDRARIGALGLSVVLRRGFWLDGYVTGGRGDEGRGFGIALRAG